MELETREQAEQFLNTIIIAKELVNTTNKMYDNVNGCNIPKNILLNSGIKLIAKLLVEKVEQEEYAEILWNNYFYYKKYKISELSSKGE